jgi:hypothetical protein
VLKYPGQLPAWWFGLFPDPEGDVAYRYTVQLTPDDSNAIAARQGIQVRSASGSEEIPPGRFTATFVFACAPAASEAPVELVVERFVGGKRVRIADQLIPGSRCATAGQPVRVPLAFPSDGYHRTGFRVLYPPAAGVADAQVSYAPQGK